MSERLRRLRRLRTAAGLTQTQLADTIASTSYISLVEAGKRVPGPDVLAHLARRLGCTADYLQHGDEADAVAVARRELTFARMALLEGHWRSALDRLQDLKTVELQHELPDDLAFDIDFALGRAHQALGEAEAAVSVLTPLLESAAAEGRTMRWLALANAMAACYLTSADLNEAARVARDALTAGERAGVGSTDEHLRLLATLAWVLTEQGDLLAARDMLQRALAASDRQASPLARGSLLWNASLVTEQRGEHAEAMDLAQRALALMGEHASQRDNARLRSHYSYLLLRGPAPLPEEALSQAERAEVDLRRVARADDVASCLTEQARALLQLGRAEEAEGRVRSALALLRQPSPGLSTSTGEGAEVTPPRLEAATAQLVLADCLEQRGLFDEADATFERAATTLSMLRVGRRAASTWRDLAERLRRRGDAEGAMRAYEESLNAAGVHPSASERSSTSTGN